MMNVIFHLSIWLVAVIALLGFIVGLIWGTNWKEGADLRLRGRLDDWRGSRHSRRRYRD